jgi:hypothetical protein
MPRVRLFLAAVTAAAWFASARPAAALEVRGAELQASSSVVQAAFELRDVVADHFRRIIDSGGVAHLRIQAEVWERRATWDLLVYPAVVRVLRLSKAPSGNGIAVADSDGVVTTHEHVPSALPVLVPVGAADRLKTSARYYVRILATMGTLAEQQVDDYGDAVFGRPGETNGLGSLGRMVLRRMLQLSDYLQSVSAEAESRLVPGTQLLRR